MKDDSTPTGRRSRSAETERKLMQATFDLIREGGLGAATAPAVAHRAGVAVGTIYRRYRDKEALVAATLLDLTSLSLAAAEAQVAAIVGDARDLAAFLRNVAKAAVVASRENRVFILAVRDFVRAIDDDVWRQKYLAQSGRARALIVERALQRFGGEIRGGETALRMALAAIYGAAEVTYLAPMTGVFTKAPAPNAFIDAVVEMQVRYLT